MVGMHSGALPAEAKVSNVSQSNAPSLKFEYPVKGPRDHKWLAVLHPDPTAYALRPFLLFSGMSQCPPASQAGSSKFCRLQRRSLNDSQTIINIIMSSVVTKVI